MNTRSQFLTYTVDELEQAVAWAGVMLHGNACLEVQTTKTGEVVIVLDSEGLLMLSVFQNGGQVVAERFKSGVMPTFAYHESLIAALNVFHLPDLRQLSAIHAARMILELRRGGIGHNLKMKRL